MDLSIIVPCYNEEPSLPLFFDAVCAAMGKRHLSYELVFVNDGSSDGTGTLLESFAQSGRAAHVTVVQFSRNFGKEAAMLAGLQEASGDVLAFIDADLQQRPETLLAMYDRLVADDSYDVVAAYQEQRVAGGIRNALSRKFYRVFNELSDTALEPNASDFRVFRRSVAEALLSMPEYYRFTKGMFSWVGFRTLPYPYVPDERVAGTSKWSLRKLLRYALQGMISFSTVPLVISGYIGGIAALIGFVYIIFVLVDALVVHNTPRGYPTVLSVVLILGGLILLSLGVIGSYLSRIYIEGKHRPIYIASDVEKADSGTVRHLGCRTSHRIYRNVR